MVTCSATDILLFGSTSRPSNLAFTLFHNSPHSFPTPYSTSSSVTLSITSCQQILEKIVAKREFPQFLPLNLKLDLHPHCCVLFPQLQRKVSLSSKAASSVRALDHILSYVLEDFFTDCLLSLYLTSSIQIC